MLKIGIIGYGYMGKIRHNILKSRSNCVVKSIFHTENINGLSEYVKRWQDIIEDKGIDAIFVCAPNRYTCDMVTQGLRAGKHIFAEKPPGISVDQVKQMIDAEQQTKKKLKFGFNHRYHPAIMEAKKLTENGRFGDILWLRGRYGKSVDPEFDSNWRSKKEFSGGGILMDQGIHMLDLFQYFCGDFQEAKAYASNLYWKGDVEDNLFAILRNVRGQVASFHSTITQWRYLFSLEVFLSNGYVVVNGLLSKSGRYGQERLDYAEKRTPAPMASHSETHSITFNTDSSWELEVNEFFDAIYNDTAIKIGNTQDALQLMSLIEKIYEDANN